MKPQPKYAFIFNPSANRSRARETHMWLQEQIEKEWPGSHIFVSGSERDAIKLASKAALRFDAVIACGGDGTIQEVVRGIHDKENSILGVIPLGTGNDFIKSAGISKSPATALKQLKSAVPADVDFVEFALDGKPGIMINTLGIGFDGRINHETKRVKWLKGPLMYTAAVLKSAFRLEPCDMNIIMDGKDESQTLVMLTLANGTTEGGNFKIAPNADITDGLLDVVMIKPMSVPGLFPRLGLFAIGKQHTSSKIKLHKCREIHIKSEKGMPVHADGENFGLHIRDVRARVVSGQLKMLVPVKMPN